MKILFIGDIFSKTGRRAVREILPKLKKDYQIDYVIANAENATHCKGLSHKHYLQLMEYGIDFFTMGNHTWSQNDIYDLLNNAKNIIRPGNIINNHKFSMYGCGTKIIYICGISLRITNLIGNSVHFHQLQTNPFDYLNNIIEYQETTDFHIVDFHAETTSEKNALFFAFKGRVSAILGTHTHIQTADNKIRNNTAFITDVGLTGPADGIIGAKAENVIKRFSEDTNYHYRLKEEGGYFQFCGVVLDFDIVNKKIINFERIYIYEQDLLKSSN